MMSSVPLRASFVPPLVPARLNALSEGLHAAVPPSHLSHCFLQEGIENNNSGEKEGKLPVPVGRWDNSAKALEAAVGRVVGRRWDETRLALDLHSRTASRPASQHPPIWSSP